MKKIIKRILLLLVLSISYLSAMEYPYKTSSYTNHSDYKPICLNNVVYLEKWRHTAPMIDYKTGKFLKCKINLITPSSFSKSSKTYFTIEGIIK